ncbi:MAG: imidazole glycerol phosphate synthase subunit HisH [Pseudomonadota bacterium]
MSQTTAIVDYGSGNLRSAEKSFARMALELDAGTIVVTADPEAVRAADRIVLPGVGAFADCRAGLLAVTGMYEVIVEKIAAGTPFFGICVGMQLLASVGREFGETPGFDLIPGAVVALEPGDAALKIPHMGWNALSVERVHPVLAGVEEGDHAYFVHSFHLVPDDEGHRVATVGYGQPVTAAVARDTIFGTQFHPEKSQKTGLRIIGNFLEWRP